MIIMFKSQKKLLRLRIGLEHRRRRTWSLGSLETGEAAKEDGSGAEGNLMPNSF